MDGKSISRYFMYDSLEKELWKECIFVFDTSALLNFYNYSPNTKDFLFKEVFPKLKGRLWLPNHVEFEYLKNRKETLKNPIKEKYGKLEEEELKSLKELSIKFSHQLVSLKNKTQKKFAHPYFDQSIFVHFDPLNKRFDEAFEELILNVEKEINSRKDEILSLEQSDDVLKAIETFFASGKPFTFEQLLSIAKEGEFRYKHKIPPGYEDTEAKRNKVGLQIFGDLIIWKQILEYARIATKPLVFITDDVKSDWCFIEKKGSETRITRPKEELIKEIYDFASVDFWMYTLSQFVYNIDKYYSIKPKEEVLSEIELITKNDPLVYNKLYVSGANMSYKCLKFFEDGEVISVSLGANIEKRETQEMVNMWFHKGYESRGQFEINENRIRFSIQSTSGNVDYDGIIDNRSLNLTSISRINGHKESNKFKLLDSD